MEKLEIDNKLVNEKIIEKQRNFFNSNIGKAINIGMDIGIRCLFPDLIENQIINIKNSIIEKGFKEGIDTAVNSAIDLGKSALGIINGNFESIEQMQNAVKTGGIIDSISNIINFTIDKSIQKGKLPYKVGKTLKQGKNIILNNVTKNIENEFQNQVNDFKKLNKYINQWKEGFEKKNFEAMEREYKKIKQNLKINFPVEKIIKEGRTIENLHELIKRNGQNFNLTKEQLELAKML